MALILTAIKKAIEQRNQTRYGIAKGSGIAQSQLSRLMSGKTGLNVETVELLADYLGLEIIIQPKRRTTRKGR
jgi:transcriptional regulator with XRE-family HTH domain